MPAATGPGTTVLNLLWLNDVKIPTRRGRFWKANNLQYYFNTFFTTLWYVCSMHRQPEHVMAFLLAELGTSGSLDGQQRLVVKGRFAPKVFEGILRRYVSEYLCPLAQLEHTPLYGSLNFSLKRLHSFFSLTRLHHIYHQVHL